MSLLPDGREALLRFFETHLDGWAERAAEIGLTPEEVADFAPLVEGAREALEELLAIRTAAKAATQRFYTRVAAMSDAGRALVRTIKAAAASSPEPGGVYAAAQVAPPARPASTTPATPVSLRAAMDLQGVLTLRWRPPTGAPSGANIYIVERRARGVDGGAWSTVGVVGRGLFVDEAPPAAVPAVEYRVLTQRYGRRSGYSGTLTFVMGAGARGGPGLRAAA